MNIKLDQTEFTEKGPLSGDSRFNMDAQTVKKVFKVCFND